MHVCVRVCVRVCVCVCACVRVRVCVCVCAPILDIALWLDSIHSGHGMFASVCRVVAVSQFLVTLQSTILCVLSYGCDGSMLVLY